MRPRIGITVHLAEVRTREGDLEHRYELASRYAEAVRDAGGLPLLVPTHPGSVVAAEETVAAIDGLLLSGGGSLPASYFDEHRDPGLRDTNPLRYDVEAELVRAAAAAGLPLLGICRGQQTIVEALGGELVRDLRGLDGVRDHYQTVPAAERTHGLRIRAGTRLARTLGPEARVNSFHRQVVARPPEGWRVSAWSEDGLVEAVEALEGFGLGCQFHPEHLGPTEPGFASLFEEFVVAAASRTAA